MAQSALSAVVGSVSGLAVQETSLLCGVKDEIDFLKDELARLQGLLQDLHDKQWSGHTATIATWVCQIRVATEDAENAIEDAEYMEKRNMLCKGFMGAVTRYASLPCDLITLHKVGVEVRRIRKKIFYMKGPIQYLSSIVSIDGVEMSRSEDVDDKFVPQNLLDDMIFCGFKEEYKQIVAKLLHPGDKLTALSIVGMGGAGKTTIARKIYTGPEIRKCFDVTAWVSLPEKFSTIDILKHIYNQIADNQIPESRNNIHEQRVGEKIYELLLQKRYLLVLDGVWETDSWSKINLVIYVKGRYVKVFPDSSKGSRVLLTTRKMFVATQTVVEMPTDLHPLSLMDEAAACELLISNASQLYRKSNNSNEWDEFEHIGSVLAEKCNRLPLALAVLGKYLAMNLNIQKWKKILEDWTTVTAITGEPMVNVILGRSYSDLPSRHLKACFLYIAAFPGNYVIYVSDLIKLWTAEGLILHNTRHSPEEEGHNYVSQLAQRSMVQVVSTGKADGRIEQIRIHDVLRYWCIEEARKDGFLDVIDKTTRRGSTSSSKVSLRSFYDEKFFQRREKLRTLFGFKSRSVSLPKLRYLRVLHIEEASLKNFSESIVKFIHLRYLCLRRCAGIILLSSIGQLLYLQTVDLRGTQLSSVVPHTFWDIPDLRHVYLEGQICAPRNCQQKELETLHLSGEPFMGKLILETLVDMPRLVEIFLSKFNVVDKLPESKSFPQGLQQLHLFASLLEQDPMPILEKLPNLIVLELWGYEGQAMSCSANGFPRLLVLKLGGFSIAKWSIEDGAMKVLSNLALEDGVMPRDLQNGAVQENPENVRMVKSVTKLPKWLLHLQSLKELKLVKMPQISIDYHTYEELEKKSCKVIIE